MAEPHRQTKKKLWLLNTLFLCGTIALLILLFRAPEETTARLPRDEIHQKFYEIKSKKQAERQCGTCHTATGEYPLPASHPAPYRCFFCHKRQ